MNWPDFLVSTGPDFREKVSKKRIGKTEGGKAQGIQLCGEPENSAEFYSLMRDGGLSEDDGVYRYFDTGAKPSLMWTCRQRCACIFKHEMFSGRNLIPEGSSL